MTAIVPHNSGTAVYDNQPGTVRSEFGAESRAIVAETASVAAAAQAKAQVEARYVMALQRPRDLDNVRVKLLRECTRPGFAAVARYRKPVGQGVEGPSIRFAEAAMRALGNLLPEVSTVYDDRSKRIVRVSLTDLESNLTFSKDVVIEKTVERSFLKTGQEVIATRLNSQGKPVHLVHATDDDLLNKENALVSKALRTAALRVLPGDILEECMTKVQETLRAADAADPDAARKKLADAFAAINVQPASLAKYLGHELATVSPAELVELRAIYAAIKEGETTWHEALAHKTGGEEREKEKSSKSRTAKVAEAVKASVGDEAGNHQVEE